MGAYWVAWAKYANTHRPSGRRKASGQLVKPIVGEVCVRGACVTGGYELRPWQPSDPNVVAFVRGGAGERSWLRTGRAVEDGADTIVDVAAKLRAVQHPSTLNRVASPQGIQHNRSALNACDGFDKRCLAERLQHDARRGAWGAVSRDRLIRGALRTTRRRAGDKGCAGLRCR